MWRAIEELRKSIEAVRTRERSYSASARVYNSANLSINNTTFTDLTFDTERWDDAAFHSTSVNTARFTIPRFGRYAIGACIRWASNVTGHRQGRLLVDGSTEIARVSQMAVTTAAIATMMEIFSVSELGAGQYVTVQVYQDSGGALNVEAQGNYSPEFWIASC